MTDMPSDAEQLTDPFAVSADAAEAAVPAEAAVTTAAHGRHGRRPLGALRHIAGGIGAVGVKELRGRMRGRRAFVILTIYLLLLGGFVWMVELIAERSISSGFGSSATVTAAVGQGIFAALIMLETLQVVFLAPASTAGAISLEREKQTLELLLATPISSVAIVLGKLLSALVYVWLLIAASIPLTAVVFVFGGVGPEDVVRSYLVLVVTALGLGSFGVFASSLVKRTQAATAISVFAVLAVSIGSIFLLIFWQAMASSDDNNGAGAVRRSPPQVIAYLNPFIAQLDVLCGSDSSFGGWCSIESSLVPSTNGVVFINGQDTNGGAVQPVPAFDPGKGGVVPLPAPIPDVPIADVAPFGVARDAFWPKSVVSWLVVSFVLLVLSVQFVSPTRRWHLRRRNADPGRPA